MAIAAFSAFTAASSYGAILLNEPFNVAGTMGTGTYASWTSISGTGAQLAVNATTGLAFGTSDRDYSRSFTSQTGDTFSGFDLRISTLPTSGSEYIAIFADGTGFDGRIFLTSTSSGANFTLGLDVGGSSATASTGNLSLSTTYRVVTRYNPTSDAIALWVGTFSESTPTISTSGTDASTSTNAFAIRQAGVFDNGDSALTLQNLIVATTFAEAVPEPSTALLGAFGALALLRRRR